MAKFLLHIFITFAHFYPWAPFSHVVNFKTIKLAIWEFNSVLQHWTLSWYLYVFLASRSVVLFICLCLFDHHHKVKLNHVKYCTISACQVKVGLYHYCMKRSHPFSSEHFWPRLCWGQTTQFKPLLCHHNRVIQHWGKLSVILLSLNFYTPPSKPMQSVHPVSFILHWEPMLTLVKIWNPKAVTLQLNYVNLGKTARDMYLLAMSERQAAFFEPSALPPHSSSSTKESGTRKTPKGFRKPCSAVSRSILSI